MDFSEFETARTRVRSPQTSGVVERFFGTLRYEHLYRATIGDDNALAVEHCHERVALADPLLDWEVLT
jgi:transposase InsO family protein